MATWGEDRTMKLALRFHVHGQPQPRGSKTPRPIMRNGRPVLNANGRPVVATRDDNPKSRPWMADVANYAAEAAESAGLELIDGPVMLRTVFTFVRPKGHFRANGRVKDKAPAFPTGKPDVDKLLRAIGDALTGVVIRDDSRIVRHESEKRYGPRAGAEISVYLLPQTVIEGRRELIVTIADQEHDG